MNLSDLRLKLRALLFRGRVDGELREELDFHIEMQIRKNLDRGMPFDDARRQARLKFGSNVNAEEACRDARGIKFLGDAASDARHALRRLAKNPAASLTIITNLTIGIGACTLIFTLANALLFRPLPVENPDILVQLFERYTGIPRPITSLSHDFYRDVAGQSATLVDVVAQREITSSIERDSSTERAYVQIVSQNYFSALGVHPYRGRLLAQGDDHVAVLSYGGWMRYFGRDPSVIGKAARIGERSFEIIGITERAFNGVNVDWGPDVFVPMLETDRDQVEIFARLRPGVSLEQAREEVGPIWRRIAEAAVARDPASASSGGLDGVAVEIRSISLGLSSLRDQFRNSLLLVFAGTGVLLFVVCANVSGLLLARAKAHERETAVRLALGAGRARIVRPWLIECLIYAALGAVGGIALTNAAIEVLLRWIPVVPANLGDLRAVSLNLQPDLRIFGFCVAVSFITAILCAVAPVWHSSQLNLYASLRGATRERAHQHFQAVLCAVQVALCSLLLVWAGLMVRTSHALQTADPGFDRDHVVTFALGPSVGQYEQEKAWFVEQQVLERTRMLPGVRAAGIADVPLMRGIGMVAKVALQGQAPEDVTFNSSVNAASPGYFDAMGMRLLAGRDFEPGDERRAIAPAVVNEAFARHFFGDRNPIGQTFSTVPHYEIVGVVGDTNYRSMREAPPRIFYTPVGPTPYPNGFVLHIRTEQPDEIIRRVRELVNSIDPALPLNRAATLSAEIDRSLWQERLTAVLAATFGVFATVQVGVGLYGIVSYFVVRFRRELGMRLAIGARSVDIGVVVLKRVVPSIVMGLSVGTVLYVVVARWIRSVLFRVGVFDPISILGTLAFVIAIVGIAAAIPTLRAIRLHPMSVLRQD